MECNKPGNATRSRKIIAEAKYGGESCPKDLQELKSCFKICDCMFYF
jgi:hypothetical protein